MDFKGSGLIFSNLKTQNKINQVLSFTVYYINPFWNTTNLRGYYNSYFMILQTEILYQLRQKAEGKTMLLALLE